MNRIAIALLLTLCLAPAWAAESPPAPVAAPQGKAATPEMAPGAGTRAWLQLQASGRQASPQRPTLSGEVMEKTDERYVNSFGQPVPTRFTGDRVGNVGTGPR